MWRIPPPGDVSETNDFRPLPTSHRPLRQAGTGTGAGVAAGAGGRRAGDPAINMTRSYSPRDAAHAARQGATHHVPRGRPCLYRQVKVTAAAMGRIPQPPPRQEWTPELCKVFGSKLNRYRLIVRYNAQKYAELKVRVRVRWLPG